MLVLVIIILFPNMISVVFSILQLHNKIIFLFSLDILFLLSTLLCYINLDRNKYKRILSSNISKLRMKYLKRCIDGLPSVRVIAIGAIVFPS